VAGLLIAPANASRLRRNRGTVQKTQIKSRGHESAQIEEVAEKEKDVIKAKRKKGPSRCIFWRDNTLRNKDHARRNEVNSSGGER